MPCSPFVGCCNEMVKIHPMKVNVFLRARRDSYLRESILAVRCFCVDSPSSVLFSNAALEDVQHVCFRCDWLGLFFVKFVVVGDSWIAEICASSDLGMLGYEHHHGQCAIFILHSKHVELQCHELGNVNTFFVMGVHRSMRHEVLRIHWDTLLGSPALKIWSHYI
ncbi:hypothetical protein Tco_0829412 [Tanacetum coccineum]